jgi:hypothetical protein
VDIVQFTVPAQQCGLGPLKHSRILKNLIINLYLVLVLSSQHAAWVGSMNNLTIAPVKEVLAPSRFSCSPQAGINVSVQAVPLPGLPISNEHQQLDVSGHPNSSTTVGMCKAL